MSSLRQLARLLLALLLPCLGCGSKPPPEPSAKPLLVPLDAPAPTVDPALTGADEEAPRTPVRVGILHSLSGTMALYESPLKDMALMAIEELNAEGGVLGRPIEPIVADPASNWPLFAEKARELLEKQQVQALFGGYTSVSRKAMQPVVEELKGLLFYPAEYEGEKASPNIAYAGAVPNQSVKVVVDYLLQAPAPKPKRWLVMGTDYVLPRVQSKVIVQRLVARGVKEDDVSRQFFPFGHGDFVDTVKHMQKLTGGQRTVLISLLVDESANALMRELAEQHVSLQTLEVVSFGIDERQLAEQPSLFQGTLVASSYFNGLDNPVNAALRKRWASYVRAHQLPAEQTLLNDELVATYLELRLWKKAVESAKSIEPALVAKALSNQSLEAPSGFTEIMDATAHHLHKPYFVGRVGSDGRVGVVFRTPSVVAPDTRD